jgi:hypothetical protein
MIVLRESLTSVMPRRAFALLFGPLYRMIVVANLRLRLEDVAALVGPIDPEIAGQIIATGATREEIAQAVTEARGRMAFDENRPVRSARIAAVCALVEPLFAEDNIARGRD